MSSSPEYVDDNAFPETPPPSVEELTILAGVLLTQMRSGQRSSMPRPGAPEPSPQSTVPLQKAVTEEKSATDSPPASTETTTPHAQNLRVARREPTFYSATYPVPIGITKAGERISEFVTVLGPRDCVALPIGDMAPQVVVQEGETFLTDAVATVIPVIHQPQKEPNFDLDYVNISADVKVQNAGILPEFQIIPGTKASSALLEGLANNIDFDENPHTRALIAAMGELQERSVILENVSPRKSDLPPIVTLSGPQSKNTYFAGLAVDMQAGNRAKYVPLNPETAAAVDEGKMIMIGHLGIEGNGETTLYGPQAFEPPDSKLVTPFRCLLVRSTERPQLETPEPLFVESLRNSMRMLPGQPDVRELPQAADTDYESDESDDDTASPTIDWGNTLGFDAREPQGSSGIGRLLRRRRR